MAKKKLTKLEQTGIIALIVIIACFFYVKKIYEPECGKLKALRIKQAELLNEVKALKRKQGSRESVSDSIRRMEEELDIAKSELKKAGLVLAGKEELSEVLTMVSRLAGEHDLKIREFSPAGDKVITISESVSQKHDLYNLIMVGGFLDVKDFIKDLGLLPKHVAIEQVVIEREGKESNLKITILLFI